MKSTFRSLLQSALVVSGIAVLPLSIGSAQGSCNTGSLDNCLGFTLHELGNPGVDRYSLQMILEGLTGGSHSSSFDFGSLGPLFGGPFAGGDRGDQNQGNWDFDGDHGDGNGGGGGKYSFSSDWAPGYVGGKDDWVDDVTTTPEPASLLLIGTGLFGVVGIGALRRRRK